MNGLKSIRAVSPELYAAFEARASRFEDFGECDQHGKRPLQGSDLICVWPAWLQMSGVKQQAPNCRAQAGDEVACAGNRIKGMNPDAMDLSGDMAFKAHGELGCRLCPRNTAEADRVMAEAGRAASVAGVRPGFYGWSNIQQVHSAGICC